MRKTLFISDLHLNPAHPEIEQAFLKFLAGETNDIDTLYILGDLFEYWIGDDDIDTPYKTVLHKLMEVSAHFPLYFLPGNRDFLVGETFEKNTGCKIIKDGLIIDLYGTKTMLLHGDTLCTDDIEYQQFRKQVRSEKWIQQAMSMSLDERRQYARQLRQESQKSMQHKQAEIMDVSPDTVMTTFRSYDIKLMIHGHTHRPGIHSYSINNRETRRIVLGDWHRQGSFLVYPENGQYSLESIAYS